MLDARRCRSSNIVDNVLAMMQKYAGRLESLVDERTAQLAQEKRTTEALLLRMLPKYATSSPRYRLVADSDQIGPDAAAVASRRLS